MKRKEPRWTQEQEETILGIADFVFGVSLMIGTVAVIIGVIFLLTNYATARLIVVGVIVVLLVTLGVESGLILLRRRKSETQDDNLADNWRDDPNPYRKLAPDELEGAKADIAESLSERLEKGINELGIGDYFE